MPKNQIPCLYQVFRDDGRHFITDMMCSFAGSIFFVLNTKTVEETDESEWSLKGDKHNTLCHHVPLKSRSKLFCVPESCINMNHVATTPALLRVKTSLVWSCVWTATWIQNTQHLVSNSKQKKTSNKLNSCHGLMCNNPVFFSCRRPLTLRWVFPPAAAAITSGIAQLGDSFRARPSQNAGTQQEATTHRPGLWGRSAAGKHLYSVLKYYTSNTNIWKGN